MTSRQVTIINKLGLHARAAAKLAKTCAAFKSNITVRNGQTLADGKSVMSLMLLAAGQGTSLNLCCDGVDEEDALAAIEALINDRFGEGE